jgi:hypothetical protein
LSLQVVAIPMTSFGMLMNSPHSEFQRIRPQKRSRLQTFASLFLLREKRARCRLIVPDPLG